MTAFASALSDWSAFAAALASGVAAGAALVTAILLRRQWRADRVETRAAEDRQIRSILIALRLECTRVNRLCALGNLRVLEIPAWYRWSAEIAAHYPTVAPLMNDAAVAIELANFNIRYVNAPLLTQQLGGGGDEIVNERRSRSTNARNSMTAAAECVHVVLNEIARVEHGA